MSRNTNKRPSSGADTLSTLSAISSDVDDDEPLSSRNDDDADSDVFGSAEYDGNALYGAGTAIASGARLICYGLMLPILTEVGGGGAAAAVRQGHQHSPGGRSAAGFPTSAAAQLRRRLCPLRESLATLKTLLCDNEANQQLTGQLGLVPLLVKVGGY